MNRPLLILHLLGLAMGLSVSFSNLVMGTLIAKAAPAERTILSRFMPAMSHVGNIGLVLIWVTGPILVFSKYGGFAGLPWQFHAKLTAVVILTLAVGVIHMNMRKAIAGDAAAVARIGLVGRITMLSALTALVFAVLAFEPTT